MRLKGALPDTAERALRTMVHLAALSDKPATIAQLAAATATPPYAVASTGQVAGARRNHAE